MRLALFRELTKERQAIEVARALEEIRESRKIMDATGVWNANVEKELKEKGEAVLWTAN